MKFEINDKKVSFNIEISLDSLFFNIVHRGGCENSKKDIQQFFENNPQELEKFLKVCHKTIQDVGDTQLDEFDSICDISQKIGLKVYKSKQISSAPVKKLKK